MVHWNPPEGACQEPEEPQEDEKWKWVSGHPMSVWVLVFFLFFWVLCFFLLNVFFLVFFLFLFFFGWGWCVWEERLVVGNKNRLFLAFAF